MTVNQMIDDFSNIFCPDFTDEDSIEEWATLLGIFALGYNAGLSSKPDASKPRARKVEDSGIKPENIYAMDKVFATVDKQDSEDE